MYWVTILRDLCSLYLDTFTFSRQAVSSHELALAHWISRQVVLTHQSDRRRLTCFRYNIRGYHYLHSILRLYRRQRKGSGYRRVDIAATSLGPVEYASSCRTGRLPVKHVRKACFIVTDLLTIKVKLCRCAASYHWNYYTWGGLGLWKAPPISYLCKSVLTMRLWASMLPANLSIVNKWLWDFVLF